MKSEIEVFFKLVNTKNVNDTFRIVLGTSDGEKSKNIKNLGNTEISNGFDQDNTYSFQTTYNMDYHFETNQFFNISLQSQSRKFDEIVNVPVGSVLSSKNNMKTVNLQNIDLIIIVKKVEDKKTNLVMSFVNPSSSNTFFVLSNFSDDIHWRRVYKSEERNGGELFDKVEISTEILCLGNMNKKILLEIVDSTRYTVADEGEFTLTQIIENRSVNMKSGNVLKLVQSEVTQELTFLDYLTLGLDINLMIGIDFTASNKDSSDSTSLHYLGNSLNEYQNAMISCAEILQHYDFDKKIPLFGFGAIPKGRTLVEHIFPLNFSNNPEVGSIEEMMSTYVNAVKNVRLYGPTNFAPLINFAISLSMQKGNRSYIVLLIITDGLITDFQETKDAIVEASNYPISIIIIGVGKEDFTQMELLDGDETKLSSSTGRICQRDIVQFVPYAKFRNNVDELTQQVLKEVPYQNEDFYRGKNI